MPDSGEAAAPCFCPAGRWSPALSCSGGRASCIPKGGCRLVPGIPAADREIPAPAAPPSLREDVPVAPGVLGCGSPGNAAHGPWGEGATARPLLSAPRLCPTPLALALLRGQRDNLEDFIT